ncbi:hypothetical protein C8A05DRAFT_43153 [Staphylotrichum tortipilum]|uniref:Ankyrin n=1 Tax=Staphylotrichum tortipilum TaxID=2831512 RepID=A0AAN6RU92_9PEZI|nr:hypothetical protein C8A05DRAFT_43153 [Staphylotrichum longicolle]
MHQGFTSLPPELLLIVAECTDQNTLCSLLRTKKPIHFLLWPVLYKREISRRHAVGLIRSIRLGCGTAVSKFIAAGADINARIETGDCEEFTGYTYPLATAVVRNQKAIVGLLLQHGADVNAKIDGFLCYTVLADRIHPWAGVLSNTPLTVAVAMGYVDLAVALAQKLEDPNTVVSIVLLSDYTALEQAARCLRPQVVRQLLERGADPNKRRPGNVTLLHALLEDPDLPSYVGALEDGESIFAEVIMELLQHGADPFVEKACEDHGDEDWTKCELECNLTACSLGAHSPYAAVRRHFRSVSHRQACKKLACRETRYFNMEWRQS